ncbi:MAG: helix-turn-helix domain-containing protein [Desulfuromusa sp.]|nr:helix-turn-helix domain-containing protein [Desulfuromusa sp.]
MTRKQDKKRRSISSAQKQRHKNKLDLAGIEQGAVDCRARGDGGSEQIHAPIPAPTVLYAPPQPSKEPAETISVPVLLTIDQLGQWLNLSRSTIHRLDKAGNLPGRILLGRQVRYSRPAILSWLKERLTQ